MPDLVVKFETFPCDIRPATKGEACWKCGAPARHSVDFVYTANGSPMGGGTLTSCGEHPLDDEG